MLFIARVLPTLSFHQRIIATWGKHSEPRGVSRMYRAFEEVCRCAA
jgi:hypothetical protein